MRRSLAEMKAALVSAEEVERLIELLTECWGTGSEYEARSIQEGEVEVELLAVRKLMGVVIADIEDGVSWAEEEED